MAYFDRQVRGKINARDEAKWLNDLESFAFPFIGDLNVDMVETSHIMQIVDQQHTKYGTTEEKRLWESVPERASRMLKKIEVILAAEARLGHRDANNPAAWKDHLCHLLPKPSTIKTPNRQAALPYEQLPQFVKALRSRMPSPSSQALEYLILTASRSGEVRGARWSEIDLERGLWTIPDSRMKAGREHRVALSKAAIDILKSTKRMASTDLIWPGQGLNKPMSDATLAALVKKMHLAETKVGNVGWHDPKTGRPAVPHGFRSTFRDWVAETTEYPSEMAEIALAHEVGTSVERAYRRGDMVERRRAMMEDWASFIAPIGE
ncbi:MAG: site-specific integrase [Tateyamaria sp.]